jgi:hypothetical protein
MSEFCKTTNINTKFCRCQRCNVRVQRSPEELTRTLPILMDLAEKGDVSVHANVYVNWERDMVDGETAFRRDLDGLPLPSYHLNTVAAKTDADGNVISPYYAWQGTVTIPESALEEARKVFGDKLKGNLVHSNALTKAVLAAAGEAVLGTS